MEVGGRLGSVQWREALANQRGDHAGQYVAAAAGCHSGIARFISSVRLTIGDESSRAFEQHYHVVVDCELVGGLFRFVAGGDGGTDQPAELTQVRSQNPLTLVLFQICLLYTSPSPRDGLLSRMPSSA